MADMTFMLKFIADNAAAMKTIKDMQAAAKAGETGKQAADAAKVENSMKKAAEAGKASANAAKEAQAATKGAASEAAKAELSVRRRAATERAASAEARRARVQEVEAMREQARAATAERAAKAQAAREARLAQLEQRRAAQAEWAARQNAARSAEQDEIRRAEKIAASMRRRGSTITAQEIIDGQRRAGQAAEQAGQKAAQAESRWRRLGQAMRNISWGRIGGVAGAEMAKGIAKGVADAVTAGLKSAASNAGGIFRQGLMGGGGGGGGGGAVGFMSGAVKAGLGVNQQQAAAVNAMVIGNTEEQAIAAAKAAKDTAAATGNTIPLAETNAAAIALSEKGVAATQEFLGRLADVHAGLRQQVQYSEIAKAYAAASQSGNIDRFLQILDIETKVGADGKRAAVYRREGKDVERTLPENDPGATVALMNELISRYAGQQALFQATPAGIQAQALAQIQSGLGTIMEPSFKYITDRLKTINADMAGSGGAGSIQSTLTGMGTQLVSGLQEAERLVISISTNVRVMVEPVDQVAQSLGGWKVVIGGLVALNIAGWLGGAAAGIRAVASASVLLAASPAGRVLTGLGLSAYALKEAWSTEQPEPGSLKANARAEMQAIKDAAAAAWSWANTPLNGPAVAQAPAPSAAPATAPSTAPAAASSAEKQAQVTATAEQTALALATIEAVVPAARAMVAEVGGILSAANFHSHGVAMMQTLAAGIRAGSAAAVAAVRETTQAMRDHLPHSPAKTGPLSDLDRIRFSETLASAIRPGPAIAAVNAVAAGMRAAIPMGLTAGIGLGGLGAGAAAAEAPPAVSSRGAAGGVSLVYAPTITLPPGASQADFAQLLEEHKTQIAEMVERAAARRSDLKFE